MKIIKELNISNFNRYFFKEMINILDDEAEHIMVNDFKGCKDGSILFNLCYSDEINVLHIVFNNIDCIFLKSGGIYSYLIFCENDKNKDMINNYLRIIDQIKEEMISWTDEENFDFNDDFLKFKFRTGDNLVYNEIINISVCVISLSSVIKRKNNYYPNFKSKTCFYESEI